MSGWTVGHSNCRPWAQHGAPQESRERGRPETPRGSLRRRLGVPSGPQPTEEQMLVLRFWVERKGWSLPGRAARCPWGHRLGLS